MTSEVREFEAREGGSFRVSLAYDAPDAPDAPGKSAAHTDTYHGHFARLVPDEQVVEVLEFETADPDLSGEMTITTTLTDVDGGTEVLVVHEGLPRGVPASDNEMGHADGARESCCPGGAVERVAAARGRRGGPGRAISPRYAGCGRR